jgi:ribonucleoside-diphosphate reductase beta chain
MLSEHDLLPGLLEGITHIKQDESRHIAFGIYLINRLLENYPEHKEMFESHLSERLDNATNIIFEIFKPYQVLPFGLTQEWFLDYALKQFEKRSRKLNL